MSAAQPADGFAHFARGPRHGDAQRASMPGVARGLPAHRTPRLLQLLRGVHPHHRLNVQSAREVAEDLCRDPLAATDRITQLPPDLTRLAPGSQRLQSSGSGFHRPRGQQEGRSDPRVSTAGCQHVAGRDRSMSAQPESRQRYRRRQAAAGAVAVDATRPSSIAATESASGPGRAAISTPNPTWCLPALAMYRRSKPLRPSHSCGNGCLPCACASSTSWT